MMKKILFWAACCLALVACNVKDDPSGGGGGGGQETPKTVSVVGVWELSAVSTKVSVGSVDVSVYIDFGSDGNFTLYQKIGEGRYTMFTGKYTLTSDNKLSGSYSNNSAWGPYTASMSNGNLVLTSAGGKEVDTYKKVSSIPSSVTGNIY